MFWVKYDFLKVDATFTAAVGYTKCACKHYKPFFIILFWIQCTDSCQNCIHRQYVFFFFLPFFLSAKLGGLRACRLTPPHLMLVFVLSNKKTKFITNYSLFLKRCLIELPCMLDMYGFFFFFSVLEDVGWLQHGIHTSFMASSLFWDSNKKVTGLPPTLPSPPPPLLVMYTSPFQLCWSAPPSAVIRLQWMRFAFLMEVGRRGSWCEGGQKRLHYEGNHPSLSWKLSLLLKAYIVI